MSSISAEPRDLALGDAGHAHGLHQVIDRAGGDALDVGLLNHRRERLLRHPPGLQEAREVGTLPQLGDLQLDSPSPGLPDPVAVAVAMVYAIRRALAVAGADQALDFQFHQALGGEADHLAQQIGVGTLFQ